jgi:hypothetical protein
MRTYAIIGLAAAYGSGVLAACSSTLKIDDFSRWNERTNSLGQYTNGRDPLFRRILAALTNV